ncbi:MAG: hypothetical protein AAB527_03850 [Patescibacteria group bacterium]
MAEETARLRAFLDLLRKRFSREKERPNSVLSDQARNEIQDNISRAEDLLKQGKIGEAAVVVRRLTALMPKINGH